MGIFIILKVVRYFEPVWPHVCAGKSTFSTKTHQKKKCLAQRFLRNCVFKNAKNSVLKPEALLSYFENTIFYTQITFLHHTFFRVSITKIPSNIWSKDKLLACRISSPLKSHHISKQAVVTMENAVATKKKISHIHTCFTRITMGSKLQQPYCFLSLWAEIHFFSTPSELSNTQGFSFSQYLQTTGNFVILIDFTFSFC